MKPNYGGERRKKIEGTQIGFWFVNEYRLDGWYICTCICGARKPVHAASLNQGKSRSCGCSQAMTAMAKERLERSAELRKDAPVSNCEPLYA